MAPLERPLQLEEIRKGLETKRLGKTFHYFSEIDSTNLYARGCAERGGAEGEIVIAESQTAGRGRMGRSWASPAGVNLYLSAILRPRMLPIHAPQITLMAAVALAETVQSFIPFPPEIKWPNDLLAGGKKLAGILTESSCEPSRILFVVLGIGANINFPAELMPGAIRERATSLLILSGNRVSREAFARRLIQSLDRCYWELEEYGFGAIAPRWEAYFKLKGKRVKVDMTDRLITGKVVGIDRDGALMVEDERGALQRVIAGDVMPLEK